MIGDEEPTNPGIEPVPCPTCEGSGIVTLERHAGEHRGVACPTCRGGRFVAPSIAARAARRPDEGT